jgi:hypothetical protein
MFKYYLGIILWRICWYMPLIGRVLVRMIGFISSWVTHSLLITLKHRPCSAIADLHTLQHTVARALGFFVFTSLFRETDLNTVTITVSPYYALQIQVLHIKSSFHRSPLHISRWELIWTAECSLPLLFSQLTTAHTKSPIHTFVSSPTTNLLRLSPAENCKRTSVSPVNPRSDTSKNITYSSDSTVAWRHCGTAEVTWPHFTVARSKPLQLSLSNGERVYISAA